MRLFGGWSEIRGWLGRGIGVTSHCTGITSFLKCLSSLVVKVCEPALSPRYPSQPQGFCSTHGEMLLQRHQGYGRVLSEQHSPEKQVLILTPRGEARTQLSHTCWTSAQTPETWCSARRRATHWVATRFSGPQRADSSQTQLCLYFSQVLKFSQRWVWTSRPTQQLTSRAEAVLEDELVSMGSSSSDGAGHGDCPRSQPSVAVPLDVLARLALAALLPLLHSGPMRSPSLGHVPEPHKNCRYLMRVCRPPCGDDRVPFTSV